MRYVTRSYALRFIMTLMCFWPLFGHATAPLAPINYSSLHWAGSHQEWEAATDGAPSAYYEPTQPTMIYFYYHQDIPQPLDSPTSSESNESFPTLIEYWLAQGYNVGLWPWEDDMDAADLTQAIKNYQYALSQFRGPELRFIGHARGSTMALWFAQQLISDWDSTNTEIELTQIPDQIVLLEPSDSAISLPNTNTLNLAELYQQTLMQLKAEGIVISCYLSAHKLKNATNNAARKILLEETALIALQPQYAETWNTTHQTLAAPWHYLRSIAFLPPDIMDDNQAALSASSPVIQIRQWMHSNAYLMQQQGNHTIDPTDDRFSAQQRNAPYQ
ncbi:MAG: hypothetical protein R3Y10_02450 [Ferrimonas sp.]